MTEAQKTEAAMLKMKADNAEKVQKAQAEIKSQEVKESKNPSIQDLKNIQPKEEKSPKEQKKVDIKKYPFSLELGVNKTVHFKAWTGKTKKKFKKIFQNLEDPEDLNFKDVLEVLLKDNILESDTYLSGDEQQYLTAELRKESIGNSFEFEGTCPNCQELQDIKTSVTEAVIYKKSAFPTTIQGVEYVDILSSGAFDSISSDIINSTDYDGLTTEADIELGLHINIEGANSPLETLTALDDYSIKDLEIVIKNLDTVSSKMEMYVEKSCSSCGKEGKFITSEIPGLFDSLLR